MPESSSLLSERSPCESICVRRSALLGGIDLVLARFTTLATPLHTHPEVEIGVVVAGQRLVESRGVGEVAGPGSIVVFVPGVAHAGASVDRFGSVYRGFRISPDALIGVDLLARGSTGLSPNGGGPVVRDAALCRRLERLHRVMFDDQPDHFAERELVATVGAVLERSCTASPRPPQSQAAGRAASLAREYIERHFAERIRLEMLAGLSGVSVFSLIRLFRAATGMPPHAYLWQVRVHRAMELLRAGHRVSTVAYRTGFVDQSHLARCFKRLVGVPPGEYQRCATAASGPTARPSLPARQA